jgi:hypothetical protein
MRFITEFIFDDGAKPTETTINYRKEMRDDALGQAIRNSFGFQNPVNGNHLHHRLEIEAFPMDKWIEFKSKLFDEVTSGTLGGLELLHMIKELESFKKP